LPFLPYFDFAMRDLADPADLAGFCSVVMGCDRLARGDAKSRFPLAEKAASC
jgi:hypothetical protein